MKNILALDFGTKRWGMASCDELHIVFTVPAATQPTHAERFTYFKEILKQRRIDTLVVGLPLSLEGNPTPMSQAVEKFIEEELKPLGLPIHKIDEGLSSFEAESSIPKPKVKQGRPQRDGTVDSKAAALLLEDFLAQQGLF